MVIDPELQMLAAGGRYDEMEELWMSRMETAPQETTFFTAAIAAFVRGGHLERAAELSQLLLEAQRDGGHSGAQLEFMKGALQAWPASPVLRQALPDVLRRIYADRPN